MLKRFWINVEDGYEGNCYWIPTPDDELDEEELVGIIEIDLEPFEKYVPYPMRLGTFFYVDQPKLERNKHCN